MMAAEMDTGENFCDLTNEDSATESDMETEEMAKKTTQEPVDLSPEQLMEIAEAKKNEGNTLYKEKKYPEALALYSEAIEMCPKCVAFYGNRAATYMMMGQYTKALEDARQSVQLDPNFVKGHIREGKCHLTMGEAAAAINSYRKAQELEPRNNQVKNELNEANALQQFLEQADDAYSKKDYRKVVYCMDRSLEKSPACRKFKVTKAECLALLKRYQEAQEIANDILRMEETNADAIYVRGLCLYYQDNVEKAFQHFQHVLKFAPDHAKARDIYKRAKQLKKTKEEGNNAFKSGRLQEAYDLYTQALEIDPFNIYVNSKLYFNRATVSSKINKLDQAIKDCTRAIELDEGYLKAYLRRAKCYTDTEQYEEAVRDYEKIYKLDRNRENKKLLQDAKLELKKSKRKDYYKILGVGKDAGENEIKKAYRKRALLHHPDRHANASEEEKKEEEKKFKEIGEAYTILSDSKKKARYDSGQDIDDDGGMEFDPNTIFQTFFGAPAGGGFSFQSSGGHGFSGAGGAGGFPGGFTFQFG